MTTAQDQQSREEFEACIKANFKLEDGWWCRQLHDGGYSAGNVDSAWKVWQAARALPAGMAPLCYLRPAAATTPARAWQAWENDGSAQPVYTAAQVQAMDHLPVFESDAITVNLMRMAGLDKHKARECEKIVRFMLDAALHRKASQEFQPK